MRIAKYIANSGYCSRRDAEKLVLKGIVYINKIRCNKPNTNVNLNDTILINNKIIKLENKIKLWKFYKPIKVICTNNVLSIEGEKNSEVNSNEDLIHKGISGKAFERRFKLDSDLEVRSASMSNGMLNVGLEYSEASKPTILEIQ